MQHWLAAPVVVLLSFSIVSERPHSAQTGAPADLRSLRFLLGEWQAINMPAGDSGGFTFAFGVQDRVMTRTNYAKYEARDGRPASRHDDLMVIYVESGAIKADYFDSEQHVIRYLVHQRGDREVTFISEPTPSEPRYRLSYVARADGTLAGQFEIAPPDASDTFKPFLSWTARKR